MILLLKTHVDTYTRKDGVVVQAHEDKRHVVQNPPTYEQVAELADYRNTHIKKRESRLNGLRKLYPEEVARHERAFRDNELKRSNIESDQQKKELAAKEAERLAKMTPEQRKKEDEKRQMEAARVDRHMKDMKAERDYANRRVASVYSSAFSKNFTPEEIASIQSYYTSGDRHGAQAEGRKAAVDAIERHLRASGIEIDHVSESMGGKSKSLYVKVGGDIVRVSDHELPMTPERQTNREHGRTGRWSREVIVTDWQSTPLSQYVADIKGELTKSTTPTIIFFKSLVGPYLRGGKIVNVRGYHGRQARAQDHDGQMSLFGGPMSGKPLGPSPLNGKDAVAHTPDMFAEPQHTEPTRELIAEHERLVDVLNSPSHADDKAEAKKQAAELAEMKEEEAPARPVGPNANLHDGTTIRDAKGKQYRVHYMRNSLVVAHPIVDGKPQVSADTTVRFWTNQDQPPAGENDRTDPVFVVAAPLTKSIVFLRRPAS